MNFVFLMDPLANVKYEKDTSFILMLGAKRKGHAIFFLPDGGLSWKDGKVYFKVTEVEPRENPDEPFLIGRDLELSQEEVDAVFVRTDPPFNEAYLINTWLLDHLPASIAVINHPSGIRTVNEKIWVTQFRDIIPRTLITRNLEDCETFLNQEKDIIVKPTNGFGGISVFRVRLGDINARVTFETLSRNEKEYLVLQQYIPDAEVGDKRILLLNGDPIGAVLRVHRAGEHRNNFFAGGKPAPVVITKRDEEIIAILKPRLRELGLYFVGIDIIGNYLIEVNVTSPTCLQEMNRLYGQQLEDQVISFAETLANNGNRKI